MKEIYALGELPPLGEIPRKMYAQVIREERFGDPICAFQIESIDVPEIARDECLVLVMAAGINYNGIWAAAGTPLNVVKLHAKLNDGGAFHVAGSDASGIVYKVGADISNVQVGDEVVLHGGFWDASCPQIQAGRDPLLTPTFKSWGYETNYGSFAQFTRVKGHQVLPKPAHLSWDEAAAYITNAATSYRALYGFPEHSLKPGQVVLIWGAAGGLGCQAIQICKVAGAIPVAVVSDDSKAEFCLSLGAKGVINRKQFRHWGMVPHWEDKPAYSKWLEGVRAFGEAIWAVVGKKRSPNLVFEHPGQETIPTSCYVCETGGMVVICGGTSGYTGTLDLRYHWVRQKRFQGTHYANGQQIREVHELMRQKKMIPCLSRTFSFEEVPLAHQLMHERRHPNGNMAALVSATEIGLGRRE